MTDTTEPTTALRAGMTPSQIAYVLEAKLNTLADALTALNDQLATAVPNLQQLIMQTTPACATCLHEERGGTRAGHNLANTTVDGTAYCNEHLDDVGGRLVPRKSSGLIIAGG